MERRWQMDRPLQEGDILAGKYRIERVLAQGGMGVVVAAIHQQLEQRVALKFLLPEGTQNEAVMSRFLREAKAAVRLRSEHVARVLDVGTAENGPYIVMEYLEGRDLSAVLEAEGRLDPVTAVTYVLQAAEAIAEAHALGIIHRDLKPANLFLTKRADGTPCVKVLDFGISKLTTDLSTTKTSAVMGTPFYMAPEQLQSSRNVDVRSDIWSLGMILYELLTGTVAFRRDTLPGLCTAILFEPLPPILDASPSLPAPLAAIVERALAKRPAERHQSLAELATELAPFVPEGEALAVRVRRVLGAESRPSRAPRRSEPELPAAMAIAHTVRSAEPPRAVPEEPDEPPPGVPVGSRWPLAIGLGVAIAVAAVIAGAVVLRRAPQAATLVPVTFASRAAAAVPSVPPPVPPPTAAAVTPDPPVVTTTTHAPVKVPSLPLKPPRGEDDPFGTRK